MTYQNGKIHDPISSLMNGIDSVLENGGLNNGSGRYHMVESDPRAFQFHVLEIQRITPDQVVLVSSYGDQLDIEEELPPWAQQLTCHGYTVERGLDFDHDFPQRPRGEYGRLYRVWR